MIKLKKYQIFKIGTQRLCKNKYNIELTYEQAIINEEIIGLTSSQVLRVLRDLCGYSERNKFTTEYVAVVVENKSHYKKIKNNGIIINKNKYVRFVCGASNARNNTVFMIREDLFKPMFEIMSCGIDKKKIKIVLAKYNAYFALNASSTYEIPEPRVCVVPDYKVKLNHKFDFINDDMTIEEKYMDINDYPPFDGMGIMSIEYSRKINIALQLGYEPSTVVLRNSFIKGCICTMDIKTFHQQTATASGRHSKSILDMWGNEFDLNEIDIILTESQFKLGKFYDSWNEYLNYTAKYNLKWGITFPSHEFDNTHAFTNYQFLQVLDLSDKQIEELCKPTIYWLRDILGGDVNKLLLYFLGANKKINPNNIQEYDVKSLIYNHDLINDNHIKIKIMRSLNKKIRQAYSGKLLVDGNFSFLLSDPYALLQYVDGQEVTGLLKEDEFYNGFWNDRNITEVAGMRSPLTFASEVNIMQLKNNEQCNKWYKYIHNCCTVLNIYGKDTMIFADADKQHCPLV